MSDYFRQVAVNTSFLNSESWIILSNIEQSIKDKIELIGTPLKDWNINIYRGLLTGYNEAFIIDDKKKQELIKMDPKSDEIIRPILRGRDIKRYSYNFEDLWIINSHNGYKDSDDNQINRINIEDYPAIKKHLDNYWNHIEKRSDKGYTPYNLRNCAYMEDFSKHKMVWKRVGSILRFSYDDSGALALDSTCFATGDNIKFLVAFLNSKLGKYLLKDAPQTGTGDLLISVQAIQPLSIPIPSIEINEKFEVIIDQILSDNSFAYEIESTLDLEIYNLLNLTSEEISFIESYYI